MICRICNKEIKDHGKGYHVKTIHKISYIEYVDKFRELYPKDFKPLNKCGICGKLCKGHFCSKKCNWINTGNRARGKPSWGLGLTKETHSGLASMAEKNRTRQLGRNIWSEMSDATKSQAKKAISVATSKHMADPIYKEIHRERTRKYMSDPDNMKRIHTHKGPTRPERAIKEFLDRNKIQYTFQFFITDNGICKSYDFKIEGKPLLIEVDGDYWHGHPNCKKPFYNVEQVKNNDIIKTKLAKRKGFKVIHIWESDIKNNLDRVEQMLLTEIHNY